MRQTRLGLILAGLLALPVAAAASSPAPALVRLDQVLTQTLQDKAQGRLAPDRCAEFGTKFRVDLAAANASVPSTPANTELHARILARLGEFDQFLASAVLAPRSGDTRSALSRSHFEEKTIPAVIAEEKAILGSEPFNDNRTAQDGVETRAATRKSRSAFVDASHRAAANLLANLPAPPAPLHDGQSPTSSESAGLAFTAALGAAGAMLLFGGWGGDEIEKRLPGAKTRMGMAAALGGTLATAGFLLIPAAPLVAQEQPQIASAAEKLEPYVVDEGAVVNRVWHSEWQSVDGASGPKGSSFCQGSCMPIHAQSAIERRGLNIPGILNDARQGGLFRAVGGIPAHIRTSIDGVEDEIVIHAKYWHLLEFMQESHSQIPPGASK